MTAQAIRGLLISLLAAPLCSSGLRTGKAPRDLHRKQWQDDARSSTQIDHKHRGGSFCNEGDGWVLEWKDDFDGDTLDEATWSVVTSNGGHHQGAVAPVSGLEDTACRTAACRIENVKVADGKLTFFSERDSQDPTRYYTGAVTTKGKKAWLHNTSDYRLCVRAKLPSGGHGIWPAHWMLPDNGISDKCLDEGEVDIMEMINSDGNVYNTYHWMTSWPAQKCADFDTYHKSDAHQAIMPSDWHQAFHEFAVERSSDGISYAIDGRKVFTVNADGGNGLKASQSPFFLILNTAIGGGWPGEPTTQTQLPTEHAIDYVRVVRASR